MAYLLIVLLSTLFPTNQEKIVGPDTVPTLSVSEIDDLRTSGNDTLYVINFWATWCKPCIKELPYFEQVGSIYSGKPVKVMLVSLDLPRTKEERVGGFIRQNKIESDVYVLEETNPNYFIPIISDAWQGNIPATLVLQPKRGVESFYAKEFTLEELESIIESLIP